MPLSGHCLCKAVTYTVDMDAPLLTGYDHCDDCQRQSGSTYCKLLFPTHLNTSGDAGCESRKLGGPLGTLPDLPRPHPAVTLLRSTRLRRHGFTTPLP